MLLIAYKYYSNNMEIDMPNSPSQTSPASSLLEEGQSALDGSEPATEDEIHELQQIGNPERLSSHYLVEYLCGLNHRSWGRIQGWKAHLRAGSGSTPGTLSDRAKSTAHGFTRAEHFDQPEETNCTDRKSVV